MNALNVSVKVRFPCRTRVLLLCDAGDVVKITVSYPGIPSMISLLVIDGANDKMGFGTSYPTSRLNL
jgi:hypothetical protein